MFCPKCGSQLSDDANFCQQCGEKVNFTVGNIAQEKCNDGEINREALKIYLGDVLALECIKRKIQNKINRVDNDIYAIQYWNYYKKYDLGIGDKVINMFYNGKDYYIAMDSYDFYNMDGYVKLDTNFDTPYKWVHINDAFIKKLNSSNTNAWTYANVSYGFWESRAEKKKAQSEFLKIYEDFKRTGLEGYKETLRTIDDMYIERARIENEFKEASELLEKAYSSNIIPEMFRHNIYSIYYLHNFISTSNESLTTALLHYDLNEIKAKLDRVIEQQEDMIIQQAVLVAQNQQIIEHNKMQLKRLSSIEINTARAAQYTEIAANNAEACAWIALANYIDK